MITAKIIKKGKQLSHIKEGVKRLDGERLDMGYFASQGVHKGGRGEQQYNYPALAQATELGWFPATQERRMPMPFMRHIAERLFKNLPQSWHVRRAFKAWKRSLISKTSPLGFINSIGEQSIKESKQVFNNPQYFPQAPKNTTPVWETGDFAEHFTYKNSVDNQVRRV